MKSLILLTLALSAVETAAKPFRNSVRSAHRASVERALLDVGPDGKGPGGAICVGEFNPICSRRFVHILTSVQDLVAKLQMYLEPRQEDRC